ncbi:TATA element modulatory factor-like isoform X2 [Homarus americanus]|uniref:TATA element modulatory factor-like isoform X2 n=1 Tax=Homarus americanus TaxID=6706 RepID=UPI001C49174E|nr:TATA element modulatory factor-like isoform X2 [Homarus americanus]
MSWFDTAGFTSLARSALKEAQRTIDKALDIEENEENTVPPRTPLVTTAQTPKGLPGKLKDESENFFASFGLDKKKLPLTPANSPIDSTPGTATTSKDEGKSGNSTIMAGSLWGSFTGSFFENPTSGRKKVNDTCEVSSGSEKSIVATQPPRSSTSLPTLQLTTSPVSTQPRTSSLEDHDDDSKRYQLDNDKNNEVKQMADMNASGVDGATNEWGWGWESSIMVMSGDHQEGEFGTMQGDLEGREASLADDNIDVEGFAKSRLVVGSVDSDSGGFVRQESQGSLSGKSVDLDVPSAISEDVFIGEQEYLDNCKVKKHSQGVEHYKSHDSNRSNTSASNKIEICERRTTVSCDNSEGNTPDSIVVLNSDNSSPDGEEHGSLSAGAKTKLTVNFLSGKTTSPISSPESIEVLGSSSLVTSPSSIEVLSGPSSSDSSPTHQDSCSNTLIQDLSPPPNIVSTQPTLQLAVHTEVQPVLHHTSDQPVLSQEPIASDSSVEKDSDVSSIEQTVVKQPTHLDRGETIQVYPKNLASTHKASSELPSVIKDSDSSSQTSTSLIEDTSTSESVHSASTSSTHTVLDASIITHDQILTGPMDTLPAELTGQSPASESTVTPVDNTPSEDNEASVEDRRTVTQASSGSVDGTHGEETESAAPTVSLDISVESGGSSDTITASVDSTQMVWSATRLGEHEQQGGSEMQDSSMTGSGGAVVRCLLEEAMGDEEATSGGSSPPEREHSPSSSERSDALKVGSGHTSGHSSGDEVETTTSSDIEVISSPSLDGSTIARGSTTTSRVWVSAQRGLRSLLNDRSESPASDSSSNNNKKTNNDKGHRRNQSNFSETSESSSENHSSEVDKLMKKLSQLTEVLEARETKVMELSQVNAALQDTNLRLKGHIEELEGGSGVEATESLREEFTQRLVTMERKFQQALREKEAIKKQLEEVRAEAATRLSSAEVAREREERDTVIRELRDEGEKLSKQQLSYSNIIKKLRSKEKENETTIKSQKDKLEEQSCELERLRKQFSAKEEMERRQIDAVCQLNITNQRLEQMVKDVNAENAELEGKMTALKGALDAAYREMTELQRAAVTKDAEAQEQALSAEVEVRKQLEAALEEARTQAKREQETLMAQVLELQDALNRSENHANRKERQLRSDISELQQRVSETEARAEELSGAVSAATRPLLRQMENLQSTHSSQQATWESLETTLTRRLNEAQMTVASSSEKERVAREHYSELAASSAVLQTQVTSLRAENSKLSSQLDMAITKMESLAETRTKEITQVEALKMSFAEEIAEVKRERDSLEQQLEIEKTAVAAEKKKTVALQDQLKDRERKLLQLVNDAPESHDSTPRSSPTPSLSRLSVSGSLSESFSSQWGDEVFESGWSRATTLYDSMRGNTTATVDALTSQLRQREGEIHHLQSEVTRYEAQRESLAQELVSVTSQMEILQIQLQNHQILQDQYSDMEQKYNALLQMHGEKVEEVEELRLDLADVKEMYKAQIDQLLQK